MDLGYLLVGVLVGEGHSVGSNCLVLELIWLSLGLLGELREDLYECYNVYICL